MAALAGALAVGVHLMLRGLDGRAATISRLALVPFVVFFVAWEANLGIGTGMLVEYANGLPAAERAPFAAAVQEHYTHPIFGDPSVFGALGNLSWVIAMLAAAVAFRRAGAGRLVVALLGIASLFVLHAFPVGSAALACLAAAAALVGRERAPSAALVPGVAGRPAPRAETPAVTA
jgi:hypothetical protein